MVGVILTYRQRDIRVSPGNFDKKWNLHQTTLQAVDTREATSGLLP